MWLCLANGIATYKYSIIEVLQQQLYEVDSMSPNLQGGNGGLNRRSDLLKSCSQPISARAEIWTAGHATPKVFLLIATLLKEKITDALGVVWVERETVRHCEVLGGLEIFVRVSRSAAGMATLQGQVRTFISGSSAVKRNGSEAAQRETLEGAPRP